MRRGVQQDTGICCGYHGRFQNYAEAFHMDLANASDSKNLVTDSLVASAAKSAIVKLELEEVTNRVELEPLVQKKAEHIP